MLSVTATGSAPLAYQWYVGVSGDTSAPAPGATSSGFTTPALLSTTSYWVQVANAGGVVNSLTATVTVTPPPCSSPYVRINQVQGTGDVSPLAGQTLRVRGVVVGDMEGASPALRGFYLQSLAADDDADPATSEGLFVFEGSNANSVSVGQVVDVTGVVQEFQGQTQVSLTAVEGCGTAVVLVPADVQLPVPAAASGVPHLERFEGMLVRFHQTLYVTEHFQLGRFGQIVMSAAGRLPQPTSVAAPGALAQAQQRANELNRIIVDDDLNSQNPDPIRFGRNGLTLTAFNTLRGGDTVTDLVGVMTYTWAGNAASGNAYRVRPVTALGGGVPVFQAANPRPAAPPAVGGTLKVVGMNVLNYFLTLDNGQAICGPVGSKQTCRGAGNASELSRQRTKLTQALLALDADVIGFAELENSQDAQGVEVNALADIVERLNTSLGSSVYGYIDTGIVGTDTIRVGIGYKVARVTPVGAAMVDPNPVHNRPPVAQPFLEAATGETFTLVVNHFKSKGCGGAAGTDGDQGDGQGCFNATRVSQAQALTAFLNGTVIPSTADPDVVLVGDFNAYAKEDPIRTLELAGFTNLVSRFSGKQAYSYVFDGQWGYLDHALVSSSVLAQVSGAADYHINADEPSVLDYNEDFKSAGQVASLYNADQYRISDHDPVVVGLALQPTPVGSPDSYNVEAGSTLVAGVAQGVLANDGGGLLSIVDHTQPSHGSLTLNPDGSFSYTPDAGYTGPDSFSYTVSSTAPPYTVQLFATALAPLATIGGVDITGGGFGSALAAVPGSPDQYYGLTDRGPNVDGPGGSKIEPLPSFTPMIGRFTLTAGQAVLDQIIPLRAADGTPYNGRVNSATSTGEVIYDLDGNVLAADPNGYDPEGLVAMPDGTFMVSDEYGPFITHFDATGLQIGRLSPFDGTLPAELAARVPNRGMEGLTLTPDGSTLVGIMQSALQQDDLAGFDAKKLTPLRIVTYRLVDGLTREYLYLLDNPATTRTSVSEIAALSNTTFLIDERDGELPPGAYKKLYRIDLSGATDVGPLSTVPGTVYDALHGGLLVAGESIELLLKNKTTAQSAATLVLAGITPVTKALHLDVGALLTAIDATGHFFGHDKLEGVAVRNGGSTVVISNDSDFGIDGTLNNAPPYQLRAKLDAAGAQDDGEFLLVDLVRSTTTVALTTADTTAPETSLDSTPPVLTTESAAMFAFSGSDAGSGIDGFACSLDGGAFADCAGTVVSYVGLTDGGHAFSVRAIDRAGNVDPTPASFTWVVDTTAPSVVMPGNLVVEATSASGAVATFTLPIQASDAVDGTDPVTCGGGVSGGTFPLGATTITCSSSDHAGNTAQASFTVAVVDTTAPVIEPHTDVTVTAANLAGAVVVYTASSTHDAVGGTGVAACAPASGGQFAVGQTLVTCSAVDAAGNVAVPSTFTVTVQPPENQLPVCSVAYADPLSIWPPNHHWKPIAIQGVTDPDGDGVTTTVTSIFQDEPTNSFGDGNTPVDGRIIGGAATVRAERQGNKDGRVYHVRFTAADGRGGSCSGEVTVCVPRSQGRFDDDDRDDRSRRFDRAGDRRKKSGACTDGGALFNSLVATPRTRPDHDPRTCRDDGHDHDKADRENWDRDNQKRR